MTDCKWVGQNPAHTWPCLLRLSIVVQLTDPSFSKAPHCLLLQELASRESYLQVTSFLGNGRRECIDKLFASSREGEGLQQIRQAQKLSVILIFT